MKRFTAVATARHCTLSSVKPMQSAICLPIHSREGTLQAWLSSLVFRRCLVRISGGSLVALTESSRDFPQSLQINSGLVLRLCLFRFLSLRFQRMLRWFPRLQVATACFSCSPPDLNFLDPYFMFMLSLFHIYVHAL